MPSKMWQLPMPWSVSHPLSQMLAFKLSTGHNPFRPEGHNVHDFQNLKCGPNNPFPSCFSQSHVSLGPAKLATVWNVVIIWLLSITVISVYLQQQTVFMVTSIAFFVFAPYANIHNKWWPVDGKMLKTKNLQLCIE